MTVDIMVDPMPDRLERKAFMRCAEEKFSDPIFVQVETDGQVWEFQGLPRELGVWLATEDQVSTDQVQHPYDYEINPHEAEPVFAQAVVDMGRIDLWYRAKALNLVEGVRYNTVTNVELIGAILHGVPVHSERALEDTMEDFVEDEIYRMEVTEYDREP